MTSRTPEPVRSAHAGCTYAIDVQDRIVSVDSAWSLFAAANNGSHLEGPRVLGTSIWHHLSGLETRFLYKLIIDCIRRTQQSMTFPLRCDSPTKERRLEMCIEPRSDGTCTFRTKVLEERERPYQALFDVDHPRNEQAIPRCSWCMQIEVAANRWQPVERAVMALKLNRRKPLPTLMHTICPVCALRIEKICTAN